ncbi:nitrogenase stabilizing/protective protein NifW [Tropicimonas sp. IMCC34043]|uniref:nitrogenase stabilizing/protective protein NifW n=1 Tax=Tropicimonas sp. IMCC34043 TaxID=2248760 RepID=UPI000E21CB10|nr:nitrogenase stabilizing/protective protein NifW [Tropicimonas sp. IMCC34043]
MPKDFETAGVLDHISGLSSAEDIFTYLLMPYEPEVLNVSRLHIMKRFGSYLGKADLSKLDADETFLAARQCLKRAYGDFLESTPMKEKVFKVFRDEEEKLKARFVGLDSLKLATD